MIAGRNYGRCLYDQVLPPRVRAAGALVLLFGLPVSRITALRHTDIPTDADGTSWLQMTTQHRQLLPDADAALLHTQLEHGTGTAMLTRTDADSPRWLFPGGLPGRPGRGTLYRALRTYLRPPPPRPQRRPGRRTPRSRPRQPARPQHQHRRRLATYAQHDWTTYLAARSRPGPRRRQTTNDRLTLIS